jgi:hypothetical protein
LFAGSTLDLSRSRFVRWKRTLETSKHSILDTLLAIVRWKQPLFFSLAICPLEAKP